MSSPEGHVLALDRRRLVTVLVIIAEVLALASLSLNWYRISLGPDSLRGLTLLDLNDEANIPTFFSVLLLASVAGLLFVIGRAEAGADPRRGRWWQAMAVVALYVSLDEGAKLHETAGELSRAWLPDWWWLTIPWTVLGAVAVIALMLTFGAFVLRMPVRTRGLLVLAGAVYVAGALGCELVAAYLVQAHAPAMPFVIEATAEEFLEMLGAILAIRALLTHIHDHVPDLRMKVI